MADVAPSRIAARAAGRHAAPVALDAAPSLPPAGWYVDPFDAMRRRWWTGTEWTSHLRLVMPAEPGYVAVPSVVPPAVALTAGDARSALRGLAADLAAQRESRPSRPALPPQGPRRRWRPSVVGVAVLGLVVAALGAAVVWVLAHPEVFAVPGGPAH